MATNIDIANRALYRLGARPIVALTDQTNQAMMVNTYLEPAYDRVFSERPWGFALYYEERDDGDQKLPGWYEFTAPALDPVNVIGCHAVVEKGQLRGGPTGFENYTEQDRDLTWRSGGPRVIQVKGSASGLIVWRTSIYDPTGLPPMFIDAVVFSLAAKLAMPITKSRQTFLDVSAEMGDALSTASQEEDSQGLDKERSNINTLTDRWT